jgi:hypothetical protein
MSFESSFTMCHRRHSFARGIVECAFGMLISKFRIFETPIRVHPEKVDNVVMAAVLLHNMVTHEDKVKFTNEELEQLLFFSS